MNKFLTVLLCTTVISGAANVASFAQDGVVVGVSWNNFQEERWKTDEAAIKAVLEAAGATYISADAQSSASKQLTDIESLISQGANAIIVLAQDSEAVTPAVAAAVAEGIPVIGYDRLIENPDAFYLTFDNKEVGRLQAAGVAAVQPEGNYVFIKGNSADPNADFLFEGQMEVLQAGIDSGAIKNVGEAYTDNWNPEVAQANMEQFLTANNNEVDAVVASNDGTAGGAIQSLLEEGLAGKVVVTGQDADLAACQRILRGTQAMTVYKPLKNLATKAAQIAVDVAKGNRPSVTETLDNGSKQVPSIFEAVISVDKENLGATVVADGFHKTEALK